MDGQLQLSLGDGFFDGGSKCSVRAAKVGTIPELLDEETISIGNGLFNLATLSAVIIGMYLGAVISDATDGGTNNLYIAAFSMIGIAVVGTFLSLFVNSLPAANKTKRFPYTIIGDTISDVVQLARMGRLFRVALGISFFWTIGAIAQIYIDQLADEGGSLFESERTPLLVCVTLGIGIGSVIAGYISGGKIELRLVPWGALGIAIFALAMVFAPDYFLLETAAWWKLAFVGGLLTGIGISAGFFDVPLASYLQQMSPIERRGSILSATNFMIFLGTLVFSLIFSSVFRAPTEQGSIENLPSEYQFGELGEAEQNQVELLVKKNLKVVAAAKSTEEGVAELSLDAAPNLRMPLITELVWNDYREQAEQVDRQVKADPENESKYRIDTEKYSQLFPNDRRQVKLVLTTSGRPALVIGQADLFGRGLMTLPVFIYSAFRVRTLEVHEPSDGGK